MRQFESLYSESMMQLQEANFLLHPAQYKFVFPTEVSSIHTYILDVYSSITF